MKSQIHLIRHGITEGNRRRLYYGAADIPLTEEGIAQLTKLREEGIYPKAEHAAYYTSGMLRTEQTFSLLFGEREHEHLERLQEMRFGEFEMKSHEELKELPAYIQWTEDQEGSQASPGGESRQMFAERISGGFRDLLQRHRAFVKTFAGQEDCEPASVVVCHGGVIAVIMREIFPIEGSPFFQWIPDPGHGYVLLLEDDGIEEYRSF